jgi:thiamine biosynthesis lipoprotein
LPPVIFALAVVLLLVSVSFFTSRGRPAGQIFQYQHMLMDTAVEIRFESGSSREANRLKEAVFGEMERLERLLSRSIAGSDIDLVNRQAGQQPVPVSLETLALLGEALRYARLSGGAFDPTVAPLLDRWGFLGQQYRLPSPPEIEAALRLVDYNLVGLDTGRGTVFLANAGMAVDLGGIAKGYIVDRGMEVLKEAGVRNAFINAGGDIGLIGSRPNGTPWRIGIKHPRLDQKYAGILSLSGSLAVVTSGDYERVFEHEGRRYHHILDPETGYPAASLASVTVVAPTATEADALSTTLFVIGPERGMALVESLPHVEAVLITPGMELLVSSGLADKFEPGN